MKSHGGFSEWNLKGLVGLFTESESSRKYNILCTRATFCLAVPNSKTKIVTQFCVKLVQFHCSDVNKNNWGQSCEKSELIAERNQPDGPTRRNWPLFFYIQQKWNAIFNLMHAKKCHCMFRWNEFYVLSIPSKMLFSLPKIVYWKKIFSPNLTTQALFVCIWSYVHVKFLCEKVG